MAAEPALPVLARVTQSVWPPAGIPTQSRLMDGVKTVTELSKS